MEFAKIIWEKATPKSSVFDDFYFSSEAGIDESTYIFLEHNYLEKKFSFIKEEQFNICETGFGSGLNFLLTLKLWKKVAPSRANLEFISFEKFPLSYKDISKTLAIFNKELELSNFLSQYDPNNGVNIYRFGNVTLKLIIDDVGNINNYNLPIIDSWFLDGFAPAKNISMWSENLFKTMSKLSKLDTSFATFTASSMVRKLLEKNGFIVKKDKGFGKKREMMYGVLISN